ncbi:polyphenol oxidase family protein [Cellulomonas endophytica]|uniref:polyphenol oxidase family protein n=1 Tax=Cellulomonas endophytica TaxID=2494735 RepID=UPI001011D872|nr:polyphenol oxidase family protein [Cellulomonas endophytica]
MTRAPGPGAGVAPAPGPGWRPVDLGPGVVAGFTTRDGGTSPAPWDSANLGLAVGDDPARVLAHRRALAARVGAPVAFATQVHGATVLRAPAHPAADAAAGSPGAGLAGGVGGVGGVQGVVAAPGSVGEGDALVAVGPDVAVGVLVADCVPVLLADAAAGVVAAVHVGRRGLVAGVLARAVAAMSDVGADPGRTRAVLGPAIAGRSYEVPVALREEVAAAVPGTAARTAWGTPALDLPAGVVAQLGSLGVGTVEDLGIDTFTDAASFSFRRAGGGPTGRLAGVVRAPSV